MGLHVPTWTSRKGLLPGWPSAADLYPLTDGVTQASPTRETALFLYLLHLL